MKKMALSCISQERNSMKFITHYKEFDEEETNSILDNISNIPIQGKSEIIEYLRKGEDAGVCCSSVFDFVQNGSTGKTIHCYTDGEYFWDDKEIYHFEHYNLKLETEFVNKILHG